METFLSMNTTMSAVCVELCSVLLDECVLCEASTLWSSALHPLLTRTELLCPASVGKTGL